MTPHSNIFEAHLTSEQMSDLLACLQAGPEQPREDEKAAQHASAEAHLRVCPGCAAELSSLREALAVFQEASVVHADRLYSRLPQPLSSIPATRRSYPHGLFWIAASTILIAGILPVEMRWQKSAKAAPAISAPSSVLPETDEALLEEVDRELSLSVPAPMQVLADPAGDATGDLQSSQLTTQIRIQRKN